MEEVMDFDNWLAEQAVISPEYSAIFDPSTGNIKAIYPKQFVENEKFKVDISNELADSIFNGKLSSNQCIVDLDTGSIEIVEIADLTKIDHVLHRVTEKKHSKTEEIDIHITYDRKNSKMIFELSSRFNGTYRDKSSDKKKRVLWDKNTVIDFLLTEYNDPNILIDVMSFNISDMIGQSKTFNEIQLPNRFSIFYTNRLLKNYVYVEL